jgi:DNA-binding FadR family transcriptional regulator
MAETVKRDSANVAERAFQPLNQLRGDVKLSDRVVREIEDRIVSGELQSGQRLPTEAELCELLDVSRSVVRDAVRTLAARGLLEVRQGRGMIVAEPDDNAYSLALTLLLKRSDLLMRDVLAARTALETQLGLLAVASCADSDVAKLEEHLERLQAAIGRRDWQQASDSHAAFHAELVHALHLPALDELLKPMQALILMSSAPPLPEDDLWDVKAHFPIIEALRKRDASAMAKALKRHYDRSRAAADDAWLGLPFREAAAISRQNIEQRAP